MLMILLSVLAVGLLTLSSVSLRSTQRGEAMAIARSNARLGLMLALGDLQKELGPDQKISAVSDILASGDSTGMPLKQPHLTGVWKSRQEALGTPFDYDPNKSFVRWLVSSSKPNELLNPDFARSGILDDPALMVGGVSQPTYAGKIVVSTSNQAIQGRTAWWVGDENCKGFINPADPLTATGAVPTVPDLLAASSSPGAYGINSVIPDFPANTATSAKVITLSEMALAVPPLDQSRRWFHDLSPYASGLLTNVCTGGWRQDLNLYLEMPRPPEPWPGNPLAGPNGKSALSEVNDYDVLAWKYLHNYYHLKERVQLSGGRPFLRSWNGSNGVTPNDLTNPRWNAGVIRPTPVLVRAVIFIAFGSIPSPTDPSKQVLRFYAYPVITLWNPYNVDLKVEANQLNYLFTSLPMGHKIYVNDHFKEEYTWRGNRVGGSGEANNYSGAGLLPLLNKSITLLAGEARMLSSVRSERDIYSQIHQTHFLEDVPFRYSQASPGGLWGGGRLGGKVDDQQIVLSTGTANDVVRIETFLSQWDKDGGAFHRSYPATFDVRGNHSVGDAGDYPTYQWGLKIGWLNGSSTPEIASPDRLTKSNRPSAKFSEIMNAPRPFMVVDMQLKALDEADLPNKTWRDCIPGHPFQGVTRAGADVTPYLAGAYKIRFDTINSYQEASSYLQTAPDNPVHTYFGSSYFPATGQSWITDREIPLAPFTSLSQLQHLPQTSVDNLYSSGFFFQNRAIGNSFASPGVPADKLKANGWPFCVDVYMNSSGGTITGSKFPGDTFHARPNIDRSFAANHLLWDDYFFSSMAAKNDVLRAASAKVPLDRVMKDFLVSGKPLPNPRYRPYLGEMNAGAILQALISGSNPTPSAYKKAAAYLTVDGAFNVNSVSVPAWKTMLAAAHQRNMVVLDGTGGAAKAVGNKKYVVSRFSMPNNDPASSTTVRNNSKWQGYRELDDSQLTELAEAIVRQVRKRGPFRSLAEFINRRLGPEDDERTKYGALQAALEDPAVSINNAYSQPEITPADIQGAKFQNTTAALGPSHQGSPPTVTQADLLNTVGPIISVRSDTFTIRAYGECRDASGKILATVWCEGVVQRVPSFIDLADLAATAPTAVLSAINRKFGRRLNLVSFRWLSPNEI